MTLWRETQTETKGKEGLHEGVECAVVREGGGWEKEQRAALAALHRSIRLYHPGAPTPSVDTGFRCFRAQESIIAR